MSGNLEPKGLYELAFGSFITYMENEAQQLLKLDPSPEADTVTSRVCSELKQFFHGTRLPTFMVNQLTKHLLIKLDSMSRFFWDSIDNECFQQVLLNLVEVFMHPDVTAIELGPSYSHGFDLTPCFVITWIILQKVCNLHNLKILNFPAARYYIDIKPVFPCQLKELTVRGMANQSEFTHPFTEILRSIVEFCPELKSLTVCGCKLSHQDITLILQCKHLETLRIPRLNIVADNTDLTVIDILSTDTARGASTLRSFSSILRDQNSLRVIVDKFPQLTEIELHCESNIDLSSLTKLKNLRSLSLEAWYCETTDEYRKILPVLGKNLVYLELRNHSVDLEFIGETCTNLKCLHFIKPENLNPSLKTIPNFKTIECLKIESYVKEDFVPFLIAQCVNIKTLILYFNWGYLNTTIEDVLRRTPPLKWIVINHERDDRSRYGDFFESLPARHPNFHVVKTPEWMRLSSQAEVFDSFGCYRLMY